MQDIDQVLRKNYHQLTPQEAIIADFILDHLDDFLSYTITEIAEINHVSKATVSRLFKRLGYSGYKKMRSEVRQLRQKGIPIIDSTTHHINKENFYLKHYTQELENFQSFISTLSNETLNQVIHALKKAKHVYIFGLRNSYPIALHLRQQLLQIRDHIMIIPQPGQTLSEELVNIMSNDLVICFSFRRRSKKVQHILGYLQMKNIPTVIVSESNHKQTSSDTIWNIPISLDSISAFDSYAVAMSFCSLLSNALLHEIRTDGRQKIHNISKLYNVLEEIEL